MKHSGSRRGTQRYNAHMHGAGEGVAGLSEPLGGFLYYGQVLTLWSMVCT